jgi:cell division protein FtsL
MRKIATAVVGTLLLVGVLYLFLYPARTYLQQKQTINTTSQQIALLKGENAKLAAEQAALHNNATIEQLARSQYGLVLPGQKAYAIVPPADTPTTTVPQPAKAPPSVHHPWYAHLEFWHDL